MSFMGVKLQKEIFPRNIYDNLIDYTFEDMNLKGPIDSNVVLGQTYGEYMKLPPENQRKSHPLEILDDAIKYHLNRENIQEIL